MRKFIRKQYWLFILFVGLSILTVFSYKDADVSTTNMLSPKQMMSDIPVNLEKSKSLSQRSLASINLDFNSDAMLKINVFCSDKLPSIFFKKNLAILQIDTCNKELTKAQNLQIINLTNGYKGQVFKVGTKKFKTDFIQLSNGINQIEIIFYTKDRQRLIQTLEITSGS